MVAVPPTLFEWQMNPGKYSSERLATPIETELNKYMFFYSFFFIIINNVKYKKQERKKINMHV